jgi:hypothetical protein
MNMHKKESAQAIVIFAIALVGIIAFVALAVDGGKLYTERRNEQSAADSAAFAGGVAKIKKKKVWHPLPLPQRFRLLLSTSLNRMDQPGQ